MWSRPDRWIACRRSISIQSAPAVKHQPLGFASRLASGSQLIEGTRLQLIIGPAHRTRQFYTTSSNGASKSEPRSMHSVSHLGMSILGVTWRLLLILLLVNCFLPKLPPFLLTFRPLHTHLQSLLIHACITVIDHHPCLCLCLVKKTRLTVITIVVVIIIIYMHDRHLIYYFFLSQRASHASGVADLVHSCSISGNHKPRQIGH